MLAEVVSLIFVALLGSFYFYITWNFNYWRKRNIRGPKPVILSGTFPKTRAGKCNLIEELHEIYLKYKSEAKFVGIFNARNPILFILDPQSAKRILTTNFNNFHDNVSSKWSNPKIEKLRTCSPFVCTGDRWKIQRNELSPSLSTSRLRNVYEDMTNAARNMINFISSHCVEVDAKEISRRYTTDVISNLIWGVDGEGFVDENRSIINKLAGAMIIQSLECVRYYNRTALFPWLRFFKTVRFFPEFIDEFFYQLTSDAMLMRLKNRYQRVDILNHLMQLKERKNLNDVQIAGHATTVLIDGYETVAVAIAHCLLLLSRNPEKQEKLRNEINSVAEMSFDRLTELPYLDQCLQETLRLFPPLPTIFKLCTDPILMTDYDGTVIRLKKDDIVYISSYSFHKDPDYFENPEMFVPERFDSNVGGTRKYHDMGMFLPFGDGPRMCLGMKLALIEAKTAIYAIVKNYKISTNSKTPMSNRISANSFLLSINGKIILDFKEI